METLEVKAVHARVASRRRARTVGTAVYLLSAAAVCVGLVLVAPRVPPWVLGVGLAVYLGVLFTLLQRRPPARTRASMLLWRDLVPVYMTVQNRDFRITDSNELFRKDFGDCNGGQCFRAYKGRDEICPNCPVEKTFVDGQVHASEETVITRDGRQASMIVHSVPIPDDRGGIAAVMEVSTNITEVKRMQRQLALMGLAVAGTAHRIKNLLMGLEGGIFVVNTGFETGDQSTVAEGWEMVERNVINVSRIVKDLLYCSKEREPSFADGVAVEEVAREVHELYRPRTEKERIDLRLEVAEGLPRGRFDREALHNLLANLVANAIDGCRFDPDQTKLRHAITVSVTPHREGGIAIEVTDDGMGIPDDANHKVFENFFSTKGTEGTGLGLLVVQKVVEEHRGTVTFSSLPGLGTTFRVVLPVVGGAAAAAPQA